MNTRKLSLLFTALLGLAGSAFAQSTPTEATVARVTGTVTATLADGSAVAVTEGTKLPQGATITTGDNSQAFLVSHGDTTSVIAANSVVEIAELSTTSAGGKVTEQKAILDLKEGNLVAKLNPAKKSVNQYAVRTPKGVAAARGTVYTVQYKGGNYTIAVVNGRVTVTPPANVLAGFGTGSRTAITVEAGQVRTERQDGSRGTANLSILNSSTVSAADNSMRELLSLAIATVAVAAQNNIGGTTKEEAAQVAKTILSLVPAVAEQTGALLNQSGVSTGGVADAIKAVVPASASAAFESGVSSGTFTPNPNTTTTSNNGTNSGNTDSPNKTTTPTPIDPSTVSRSNE